MAGRLLHPSDDNGVTPSSGASITIGDFEYVFITAVSPRNDEASLGLARLNGPGIVIPWTNEISNLGWINKAAGQRARKNFELFEVVMSVNVQSSCKWLTYNVSSKSRTDMSNHPERNNAVAAAAYITAGRMHDVQINQAFDFTRKGGVIESWVEAPAGSFAVGKSDSDIAQAMEMKEERFARRQVGREYRVALPAELTPTERKQAVKAIVADLVDRYKCTAIVALHEPSKKGDDRNYHAHILCSTCEATPYGYGKKLTILTEYKTSSAEIDRARKFATALFNSAAQRKGIAQCYECVSFEKLGINREPTVHMGPSATALERKGMTTAVGLHNRDVIARNDQRAAGAVVAKVPLTPEVMLSYGATNGRFMTKLLDRRRPVDVYTPDTPLWQKPATEIIPVRVDLTPETFSVTKFGDEALQDLALAWLYNEETTDSWGKHPLKNATRDAIERILPLPALVMLRNNVRRTKEIIAEIQRDREIKYRRTGNFDLKGVDELRRLQTKRDYTAKIAKQAASNTTGLMQTLDKHGVAPAAAVLHLQKPSRYIEDHARKVKLGDLFPTPAFDWYNKNYGKIWDRSR